MKKNLIYLILFVLLLAMAAYLVTRDRSISLDPKDVSFRVADSAAVNRIFMADRKGGKVLLTRQADGHWLVNNKYDARPDMMKVLMETLTRMEVKTPVPKGIINTVKTNIATVGIKVEIYSGPKSKQELVFYVGSSTVDTRGTYMIKAEADLPFILYMPGWEGYLTPRFFTSEEQWRERVLFRFNPTEVVRFAVQYPDTPGRDFAIERTNDSSYVLIDPANNSRQTFNTATGNAIWKDFALFRVEGFENEVPIRDSVITMVPPIFNATITERSGKTHYITTFFKSQLNTIDVVLMQGFPDLDRQYFYYREGKEFGVMQSLVTPWFFMSKAQIIERANR
jgi:hypothetical protein